MASIALPLVAVKAGQNIFSLLGLYSKDKVGINNKEHINKLAKNFVANGKMHAYHGKDDECVNDFLDIVKNNIESSKNMKNIENYAEKLIKNLIKLRKDLINPVEPFQSSVWYSNYTLALKKGQTQNVAVKSVLSKYLESGMLGGRFIKTLGGFLALGSAIAPIDHFVEHVLIGKVVAPKLDKKNTAE